MQFYYGSHAKGSNFEVDDSLKYVILFLTISGSATNLVALYLTIVMLQQYHIVFRPQWIYGL